LLVLIALLSLCLADEGASLIVAEVTQIQDDQPFEGLVKNKDGILDREELQDVVEVRDLEMGMSMPHIVPKVSPVATDEIVPEVTLVTTKTNHCTTDGDPCTFPYEWKGFTYHACIKTDWFRPWCGTGGMGALTSYTKYAHCISDCDAVPEKPEANDHGSEPDGTIEPGGQPEANDPTPSPTPSPTKPPLVGITTKKHSGCHVIDNKHDQYLDRQGLHCGSNQVMQSFKMTRSGCSGTNQQYEYTCGAASIDGTSTVYSGCEAIDNKKVQYLERQRVKCGSGRAVVGFKMTREGCSGGDQQYKVTCAKLSDDTTTTTKQSSCTQMDGEYLQYLDRQSVKCPDEEALSSFEVTRSGCSGKNMRYKYTCSAEHGSDPNEPTEPGHEHPEAPTEEGSGFLNGKHEDASHCQHMRGMPIEFLDREDHACTSEGSVMSGWRVSNQGCGGNDLKLVSTCHHTPHYGAVTEHKTACNTARGHKLEFLDRHIIHCPAGAALTEFRFIQGDCQNRDMQYHYKCAAIGATHALKLWTIAKKMVGQPIEYLDRQDLSCPDGSALAQFRLTKNPTSCKQDMKYEYTCISAHKLEYTAPPPPPACITVDVGGNSLLTMHEKKQYRLSQRVTPDNSGRTVYFSCTAPDMFKGMSAHHVSCNPVTDGHSKTPGGTTTGSRLCIMRGVGSFTFRFSVGDKPWVPSHRSSKAEQCTDLQ
jgi:hypothetical protein